MIFQLGAGQRQLAATLAGVRALVLAVIFGCAMPHQIFARSAQEESLPAASPRGSQGQLPNRPSVLPPDMSSPPLTPKQRRAILKANYQRMKDEADELAGLAKALQDEMSKANQNVLSLQIVERADRIEKLAKRIKSEAVH